MQVKQRLQINAYVSVIMAICIIVLLFLALRDIEQATTRSKIIGEIISGTLERVTLRNDYIRNNNERAKVQWFTKHQEINNNLNAAAAIFSSKEDKHDLNELVKNHEAILRLFTSLVTNRTQGGLPHHSEELSREIEDRLLSQLNMKVYDIVIHSHKLQISGRKSRIHAIRNTSMEVVGILGFVITVVLFNVWTMNRAIARRAGQLRDGVALIGEGRLNHSINITGDDEFAAIAQAVNQMTAQLRESYSNLENEIVERKQAEDALRKAHNTLEIRVQERTRELSEANETLEQRVAARTSELRAMNTQLLDSRRAALVMMEHAEEARKRAEEANIALQKEIKERKLTEDALRFLGECGAGKMGEGYFQELARYLGQALHMDFVCIDVLEDGCLSARTLAVYHDGQFKDNLSYTLRDTPCGDAVGQTICCFPHNVKGLFPNDPVLQELNAESYLGTTLWNSQGAAIGLIAVIGRRRLTSSRFAESLLQLVAPRAAGELERQQAEQLLLKSEKRFRDMVTVSGDWIWEIDTDCIYTFASGRVEEVLGYKTEEILGRTPFDLMPPEEKTRVRLAFTEIMKQQASFHDLANDNLHKNGTLRHILTSGVPIFDDKGALAGYRGVDKDITLGKQAEERLHSSLREKEILLKEVHHRVKNNLQVISSLINLQADSLDDPAVRDQFQEVRDRVRSMALVHEKLYHSEDLALVAFDEYAESLIKYLRHAHQHTDCVIQITWDLQPVALSVEKAVPCGLILNEIVTNALKHAFKEQRHGSVIIQLRKTAEDAVQLLVQDDGVGLPSEQDWRQCNSLGLRLVQMLAGQLNATVDLRRDKGTVFCLTFQPPQTA